MPICATCKKDKINKEFGSNTKSCKECNRKSCSICGNIFCPTGKKTHCSNQCNLLGNIGKTDSGCWEWLKGKCEGYGRIRDCETKKLILAHRLSYEIFKGKIEKGMFICHRCDNRSCINPDHLFQGTAKDNSQDALHKGRTYKVSHHAQGEKNGNAKICSEDVIEIRRLASSGMRHSEIAKKYGFSQTNVREIVKGHLWKHII